MPFFITAPLPINVPAPTSTFPLIIEPTDTWQSLEILQSCSIIEPVFIMQLFPILTLALIIASLKIKTPFPKEVYLLTFA